MRLLPGHTESGRPDLASGPPDARVLAPSDGDAVTRDEAVTGPALPKDPYNAWLEERRRARESEEHPDVHWVHRGPALRALDARGESDRRESAAGRLVGV